MLVFFKNLISLMKKPVRYLVLFDIFSVTDDFQWFWMGNLYKNIQLIMLFLKVPFFILYFSQYALINNLLDDFIFNINTYADDTTIYSMSYRTPDLWQQLELDAELDFDL